MARQRKLSWPETAVPIRDLCLKYNLDPGEELMKMVKETITTPDGVTMPLFVSLMGPRDGYKALIDVLKFLNNCIRPLLRSQEITADNQSLLHITINQFGALNAGTAKTIDVEAPKPQLPALPDSDAPEKN